jgi:hypothetical protein
MVGPCVEVLRQLDRTFNSVLGADQGTRHAPPDLTNDIQALISSLEEHKVYKIIPGRVLKGENEPVKDVVAIGLQNLTEGAKNPLSECNTATVRPGGREKAALIPPKIGVIFHSLLMIFH